MTTAAEILAAYRPATTTVRLLLDGDLQAEINRIDDQLKAARRQDAVDGGGLGAQAPQLERALKEAEARADDESVEFRFQAIPRSKFDALKAAHPPTEEQWAQFREAARANPFLPAPECDYLAIGPELIALSCIDPKFSLEEATELWDVLSPGNAAKLWDAAWAVSQGVAARPTYGTGTDTTQSSGPESTTPQSGESPSPSSPVG